MDIVERLRAWAECGPNDLLEAASADLFVAADEINRLRAGGCARDQGLTQYCAEAAALTARVAELEAELADFWRFVWEQFGYEDAE